MSQSDEIANTRLSLSDVRVCREQLYSDSLQQLYSGSIGYAEFLERIHRIDDNSTIHIQQVLIQKVTDCDAICSDSPEFYRFISDYFD